MQPSLVNSLNKPLLRNALRKLRQIPLTGTHPAYMATAPQETLDFLAMLAGLKPVYLLGRGLDDPRWVGGVLEIAREMNFHTVQAPYWDALPSDGGLPPSYNEGHDVASREAFYVTKLHAIEHQLIGIRDKGKITMEEESHLREHALLSVPCCPSIMRGQSR